MIAASARGHRKAGGASKAVSPLFVSRPDRLCCLCCAIDGAGSECSEHYSHLLSGLVWTPAAASLPAAPQAVRVFPGAFVIANFAPPHRLPWPQHAPDLFMSSALLPVPLQARKPVTEGEQPQECKQQ